MENGKSGNRCVEGKSGKIVIATIDDFPDARPSCPECGWRMSSKGEEWSCSNCGRRVKKVIRRLINREGNPECPECGVHMSSAGINWLCRGCWKNIRKKYRKVDN